VRREELAALGIQLPVLPTIVLGGLPGGAGWAPRLERLGLDVVSSGARADTPATWAAARAAVPHRPVKATGGDAAALAAAGCRILETERPAPAGAYRIGPDEAVIRAASGADPADDLPDDVAQRILEALGDAAPSEVWAAAAGLGRLDARSAEARLATLVEGVRLARLLMAKEQFDRG
jgi:hypothetical protein